MFVQGLLLILLVTSLVYWFVAWASAWKFFRRQKSVHGIHCPAVSILKPVKGLDPHAYENFASFCRQQYPGDFEVLFGVNDAADPAVRSVKRLQADFPEVPIRLVIVAPGALNAKVGILDRLSREARHDVLIVADADIRVGPDYLSAVVAPLADPRVGLVTCLYRAVQPENLAARLEALYINTVFLPEAILGTRLPGARFAFGSTLALRRGDLERVGGYRALADYLADDYQLAARIAALGLEVRLSGTTVATVLGAGRLANQWQREVRWARTIRASRPRQYPGLLVTYSTAIALLLAAMTGWAEWSLVLLAVAIAWRWLVAWRLLVYARTKIALRNLACLPLADLMNTAVWAAGAVGNTIQWRGRRLRLLADGRLAALPDAVDPADRAAPRWFAAAVRSLDRRLRRRQGIREISHDPQCLLRVAICPAQQAMRLSDGTHLPVGAPFGDLHFWNEHVPRIPAAGPNLAWARSLEQGLRQSLADLAEAAAQRPDMRPLEAFRAEMPALRRGGKCRLLRMAHGLGFEAVRRPEARGWGQRFVRFWENVYLWALMRVFNPGALRSGWLKRSRFEFWISRESLLGKHSACHAVLTAGG
ncbi:MAG TPA: bacteriohopanetetrol glucosamine biosynthesis glycosyltransferase HpnI [Pirellulales bacterium]